MTRSACKSEERRLLDKPGQDRAKPLREAGRPAHEARGDGQNLPVRARDFVDANGRVHRTLTVFCPRERRSRTTDDCSTCLSKGGRDDECTIHCAFEPGRRADTLLDLAAGPGSIASLAVHFRVGVAMGSATCVHVDTPIAALGVADVSGPAVVVGPAGAPIGLLRGVAVLRDSPIAAHASAGDLAVPVSTVGEWERLATALDRMVAERSRLVCTVAEDRSVVGLLTDIGALRWLFERHREFAARAKNPGNANTPLGLPAGLVHGRST